MVLEETSNSSQCRETSLRHISFRAIQESTLSWCPWLWLCQVQFSAMILCCIWSAPQKPRSPGNHNKTSKTRLKHPEDLRWVILRKKWGSTHMPCGKQAGHNLKPCFPWGETSSDSHQSSLLKCPSPPCMGQCEIALPNPIVVDASSRSAWGVQRIKRTSQKHTVFIQQDVTSEQPWARLEVHIPVQKPCNQDIGKLILKDRTNWKT